jgi:aspartate aminotransferase
MVEPAARLDAVELSGIRKMFEAAGPDTLNLGLGAPDMDPPDVAIEAHEEALEGGANQYGPTAGLPELREAVAEREGARDERVSAESVLVTTGATSALYAANQAFVDEGDEVLVPDPGFVLYEPHVELAGGTPVRYELRREDGFEPDVDRLAEQITSDTRAIVVNTPANPTGVSLDEDVVDGIADLVDDHDDLFLVADEAYDTLTYGTDHESFLGRVDDLLYVNTFSKRFAVTGWRLGYAVTPSEDVASLRKMAYYMMACPPTPAQQGVLAAEREAPDFPERMRETFARRREVVLEEIDRIDGFEMDPPDGAFYAFPRIPEGVTSRELAEAILEAGVVTVPGSAFGPTGEGHLRISYAADVETLQEAFSRLEKAVEGMG